MRGTPVAHSSGNDVMGRLSLFQSKPYYRRGTFERDPRGHREWSAGFALLNTSTAGAVPSATSAWKAAARAIPTAYLPFDVGHIAFMAGHSLWSRGPLWGRRPGRPARAVLDADSVVPAAGRGPSCADQGGRPRGRPTNAAAFPFLGQERWHRAMVPAAPFTGRPRSRLPGWWRHRWSPSPGRYRRFAR